MLLFLCLTASTFGYAQPSAFRAQHHSSATLPEGNVSLFFVDSNLYCNASGVILVAQCSGHQVTGFVPDTDFVKLDENIDYVVRHPVNGDLYFTVKDKKEFSTLYCQHAEPGKRAKIRRVDMDGVSVHHPTFSADGRFMVFSTTGRNHTGGDYDLWYAKSDKEGWSVPHNMGNRINTSSDETAPVICGQYLYFCSGGHNGADGTPSLFVTPLMARRMEGDTVGMLLIGRGRVSRMPSPINEMASASTAIAFDAGTQTTYWLLRDGIGDGSRPLYSLVGSLHARFLWGYVRNTEEIPLAGVKVTALHDGVSAAVAVTDTLGFYSLYLPANEDFLIQYCHAGYFIDTVEILATAIADEQPIEEMQRDVTLGGIPLHSLVYYYDLFEPNVSIAISRHGRSVLAPLVRFLNDNPTCHVRWMLTNDITADAEFNRLLTDQRLEALRAYLLPLLPEGVRCDFFNGCSGPQSCSSASGISRLTVVIELQ